MIENTKEAYEVPVVDISCERWNKAGVAVIKVHENYNVKKIVQKLLCIFMALSKNVALKIFMTWLIKKFKENMVKKMRELTKSQIRAYKISRSRLFKGDKNSMYRNEEIVFAILI